MNRGLLVKGLFILAIFGLAFWVSPHIWLVGLALIALGLLWHLLARRWLPLAAASPPRAR